MWTVEGVFETFRQEDAPDLPIVLPPENMDDNHDIKMIQALIARMEEKYNIDKGRIFYARHVNGEYYDRPVCEKLWKDSCRCGRLRWCPCEPFNLL